MSTDRDARQEEFRRAIGAPFSFVADPTARLVALFRVKAPLLKMARRTTFVIGKDRRILHVEAGGDAVDPSGAAAACSLY